MNSDEEDDIAQPERLPIYQKGKEIFDMVNKITALIPENDDYLNEVKSCMLSDAALGSAHSTKTLMMTYPFMVLKKIQKNDKQSNAPVQYLREWIVYFNLMSIDLGCTVINTFMLD
jgi:hypothetical protein